MGQKCDAKFHDALCMRRDKVPRNHVMMSSRPFWAADSKNWWPATSSPISKVHRHRRPALTHARTTCKKTPCNAYHVTHVGSMAVFAKCKWHYCSSLTHDLRAGQVTSSVSWLRAAKDRCHTQPISLCTVLGPIKNGYSLHCSGHRR